MVLVRAVEDMRLERPEYVYVTTYCRRQCSRERSRMVANHCRSTHVIRIGVHVDIRPPRSVDDGWDGAACDG